jgi:hypothetical protein
VLIASNSQVAQQTIAGHNPPTGAHPNIISGSVNRLDLSSKAIASFTVHCPTGMRLTARGDLCYESTLRIDADFDAAMSLCANLGFRLPSNAELGEVFSNGPSSQPDEWTSNWYFDNFEGHAYAEIESLSGSRQLLSGFLTTNNTDRYRCVAGPTN